MKTLIIAEAGVNHNGDMALAKELVEVAANCGADFVKFQTFNANRLVTENAVKADYQVKATGNTETQYEMLRKLELSEAMHHELIAHASINNIGFLSTGFDIQNVDFLYKLGQRMFKVPSGEITNLPYLRHIGMFGLKVILSTGMSSMEEIAFALNVLESAGTPRSKITVLHCTTSYPVPFSDVNLLAMRSIASKFEVEVGYSDHTLGIEGPCAAVALGATVIEKHFTLSRSLSGPDHKASLEPDELNSMVKGIRNIERALGDGKKRLMPSESLNLLPIRHSIVASKRINKGTRFTDENITTKRPGGGIPPSLWENVIGQFAKHDFLENEMIEL